MAHEELQEVPDDRQRWKKGKSGSKEERKSEASAGETLKKCGQRCDGCVSMPPSRIIQLMMLDVCWWIYVLSMFLVLLRSCSVQNSPVLRIIAYLLPSSDQRLFWRSSETSWKQQYFRNGITIQEGTVHLTTIWCMFIDITYSESSRLEYHSKLLWNSRCMMCLESINHSDIVASSLGWSISS